MFNENNIPGSYKTGSQSPVDAKGYFENEDDMKNVADFRPLQWFKNMPSINMSTGEEYVWKESVEGLIQNGYTYPNNVVSFGIDYSNKTFNFVLKQEPLKSFTVKGTSVGKYNDGDVIPAHASNDERWKDVGTKQILPTFNYPDVGLNGVLTNPNDSYEVGTNRNVQLAPQFEQNDGGDLNNCIITQDGVEIFNEAYLSSPIVNIDFTLTPKLFRTAISYDAGTIPKDDNLGNSIPNTINAGTRYSSYVSYVGHLPIFCGAVGTATLDSNHIRELDKHLVNQGNIINLETGTVEKIFAIFIPTGTTLVSVIHTNINDDITNQFVSSNVTIKDAGGVNDIQGTLYTYSNSIPFGVSQTFQITKQ